MLLRNADAGFDKTAINLGVRLLTSVSSVSGFDKTEKDINLLQLRLLTPVSSFKASRKQKQTSLKDLFHLFQVFQVDKIAMNHDV